MNETFEIIGDGEAIMCFMCGLTSSHKEDVRRRYCAHCGVFHDDMSRKIAEAEQKSIEEEAEKADKKVSKKEKKPRPPAIATGGKFGMRGGPGRHRGGHVPWRKR